jgi:hypothetical protein
MTEGERRAAARPGADWARAAEGLQLVGFAVFLLLNTTGALPWSFWIDAIALWPVLVMSAGVKIAFEKSRAPWLLLLGPALVLGSLAWLASGQRPEGPVGPWEEASLERPEGTRQVALEARLAGTRLRVVAADDLPADRLVVGRSVGRSESTRFDAHARDGVAEVRLDGGRKNVVFLPRPRQRWDLRVPAGLPLRLDVKGAGVGGDFDLTAGSLDGLRSQGVFIGVGARLPAPRRDTDVRMAGVFNSLTLTVPEGTPVRVEGAGLPFNAVDRGVPGTDGRPGYNVRLEGIFSAVEVRTDRSIPREPPALSEPPAGPSPAPTPTERPGAEAEPGA